MQLARDCCMSSGWNQSVHLGLPRKPIRAQGSDLTQGRTVWVRMHLSELSVPKSPPSSAPSLLPVKQHCLPPPPPHKKGVRERLTKFHKGRTKFHRRETATQPHGSFRKWGIGYLGGSCFTDTPFKVGSPGPGRGRVC